MLYGNEMLDESGRIITSDAHHEIVMLDKILNFSGIPHVTEKRFDGWQINYPADLIGHGRVYTIRKHSLTDGTKDDFVEVWNNQTDEIRAMPVLQAYARILCHYLRKERRS